MITKRMTASEYLPEGGYEVPIAKRIGNRKTTGPQDLNRPKMKKLIPLIALIIMAAACSTQKELSYLNNLSETGGEEYFTMDVPDYEIQPRDIIYVSVKAQTPEGTLAEIMTDRSGISTNYIQSEASQYVLGYSIDPEGYVSVPLFGKVPVAGMTIYQVRDLFQHKVDSLFRHAYVEVRLLSYKFTVIGEVRMPGTFINYNDQLTVLEAIGRAGGIAETGTKEKILVIRPTGDQTITYHIDLQDKSLLSSPAYFITPNDVVIVQPNPKKVFNVNLPTISFVISTVTAAITTTLLLINYFGK
jgi:polysaccharide export outer membrane protein